MKTLVWIILFLHAINILITPVVFGMERKPYSYRDFVQAILGLGLILPVCGRVVGWW